MATVFIQKRSSKSDFIIHVGTASACHIVSVNSPMSHPFCDPPTASSLAEARQALQATRTSVTELDTKIDAAEAALAHLIRDSQRKIDELLRERATLEEQVLQTMAYLSPIRRLPIELLRDVFMWCFLDHPCCAWVLASVCSPWRRLALRMPKLWSKVCCYYNVSFSSRSVGVSTVLPLVDRE